MGMPGGGGTGMPGGGMGTPGGMDGGDLRCRAAVSAAVTATSPTEAWPVSAAATARGSGSGAGDVGGLDDEFDKSLGDFDDGLLEEQQRAAETGRDLGTFEKGAPGGGQGGMTTGGIIVANQSGSSSTGSGSPGQSSPNQEGSVEQMSSDQIGERTPEDIPQAFDDDIVAKQLREAALAEDDPELRERLWDEYRAYKGL